jgi:hypothetical protein
MSQQAQLTVFDGAATPVSHAFVGEGMERLADGSQAAKWREINSALPLNAQLRLRTALRELPSGMYRTETRLEVPTMEATSGADAQGYTAQPKVAFTDTYILIGLHSPRSTVTGRRLARQMITNAVGGVSTSVAPVTTGNIVELYDYVIQVN